MQAPLDQDDQPQALFTVHPFTYSTSTFNLLFRAIFLASLAIIYVSNMNNNSTESEVMPDRMEIGSNSGNFSGLAIETGGSKQERTSGDTVSDIEEHDYVESCSGNYSGLAIELEVSKKE